nr:ribonuclease H-like domain-containing protein [Tanacetum cinerariifolium]
MMTSSDATTLVLLSDKLSLVTHHHLLTRVPIKLDLENWNCASWVYFFEQLCSGYEVTTLSMLTTKDTLSNSKAQSLPVDSSSSSHMVLMAESGTTRRSSTPQVKSWRPCYNFVRGSCRFGNECKFVYDMNAKPSLPTVHLKSTGPIVTPGQETTLPHAFTVRALHDPTTDAWNMVAKWIQDFMTRRVLLLCDSTEDLYPITAPSLIPYAFFVSQNTCHQRLGHLGSEVLRHLVSNNIIPCNKEKPLVLFHACQLGKHIWLPFASFDIVVTSCFDIIHSDVWTSPISSLSGF